MKNLTTYCFRYKHSLLSSIISSHYLSLVECRQIGIDIKFGFSRICYISSTRIDELYQYCHIITKYSETLSLHCGWKLLHSPQLLKIAVELRWGCADNMERSSTIGDTSATTLSSSRNTGVFRTALPALPEPRTIWRRIKCFPSPTWRVALHIYLLYFHQQNEFWSLEAWGSVWELSDQNHRVVKSQSLLAGCSGLQVLLGAPESTLNHCRAVRENIFFGNATGAPGNHSYYISFNDFQNSWIPFVFSSMYLCIYVSV
jgi:hypothetical protein